MSYVKYMFENFDASTEFILSVRTCSAWRHSPPRWTGERSRGII